MKKQGNFDEKKKVTLMKKQGNFDEKTG